MKLYNTHTHTHTHTHTMSTTTLFQKPESQPKPHDKSPQRWKCHKDIILPWRQVKTHKPLA